MDVRRYIQRPGDILELAQADAVGVGLAESLAFTKRITEVQAKSNNTLLMVSHGDFREDYRYLRGMIAGLEWRRALLDAAKAEAAKMTQRTGEP